MGLSMVPAHRDRERALPHGHVPHRDRPARAKSGAERHVARGKGPDHPVSAKRRGRKNLAGHKSGHSRHFQKLCSPKQTECKPVKANNTPVLDDIAHICYYLSIIICMVPLQGDSVTHIVSEKKRSMKTMLELGT